MHFVRLFLDIGLLCWHIFSLYFVFSLFVSNCLGQLLLLCVVNFLNWFVHMYLCMSMFLYSFFCILIIQAPSWPLDFCAPFCLCFFWHFCISTIVCFIISASVLALRLLCRPENLLIVFAASRALQLGKHYNVDE